MKTLNEVIEALEACQRSACEKCPYFDPNVDICDDEAQSDALYYLKEYQKKQNTLKGKWQVTSIKGETWGICSNCNFKQKAGELNFCPNCGADMREDIPMEYFENGGI